MSWMIPARIKSSMKSSFILCTASHKAEIIFDMVDITFNNGAYFVRIIPFLCTLNSIRVSAKILFMANVDHTPTFRTRTGIIAETHPVSFLGRFVVYL